MPKPSAIAGLLVAVFFLAEPAARGADSDAIPVSVQDFGARGDGTSDDTAAIQNAIAAGSVVLFPRATYVVSGLTVPSDRTLRFDGTTIRLAAGSNANAFTLNGASNVRFAGTLRIDGHKAAQTLPQGGGLLLAGGSSGNHFESVEVVNPMDYGLAVSRSSGNTFESLRVTAPGGRGVRTNYQGTYLFLGGADNNTFNAIYGEGAAGDGIHLAVSTRNCFGLVQLQSGGKKGIALVMGSTYNTFTASFLESNGDNGAFLEGGSDHNRFTRVYARNNTGNGVECNSDYNVMNSITTTGSIDGGSGGFGVYVGGSCNLFSSIVSAANERDGVRLATGGRNVLSVVALDNSQKQPHVSDGVRFADGATDNILQSVIATDTQAVKTQRYELSNSTAATRNIVLTAYLWGNAAGRYISSGNDLVAQPDAPLSMALPGLLSFFSSGSESVLLNSSCSPAPAGAP